MARVPLDTADRGLRVGMAGWRRRYGTTPHALSGVAHYPDLLQEEP
jgi:hypothetical protein